jgi:hypothetical protein
VGDNASTPTINTVAHQRGVRVDGGLLATASEDLTVSPMSDVIELPGTRARLSNMLGGIGYPFLVLRIEVAEPSTPATPRHDPVEVIAVDKWRQ